MAQIPDCYYRVSVKALILNETRDKFLICKEENGMWDLPGGGLEWGIKPQMDLSREVQEEMGLVVIKVADHPSYFLTDQTVRSKTWMANIIYETEVEHLQFKPSDECVDVKFVNASNIDEVPVFPNVIKLVHMFTPEKH